MIDVHGGPLVDGQCAVTWGVMAPADGGPGVLHVCRSLAVPDMGNGDPHKWHNGPHRCSCGSTRKREPGTVVVCCHPVEPSPLGLCGVTVTGTHLVDYRGPRRLGRDQMRAQTILSVPCGHPTQRQAS